jgi:glycosyltransferase involved in cell wall biosynthesis
VKLLFYTKYTRRGASSRLRSFQYFPLLEQRGCTITASPLFNNQYLEELYGKKGISKLNIVKQYSKRLFSLLFISKYDLIIIEKELFPYLPSLFEWLLKISKVKYVVDYDDAIFYNYEHSNSVLVRFFLKTKIDRVMRFSALTFVGNEFLKQRAISAGAKNILLLPTVIDSNKYEKKEFTEDEKLVIGWIGTPVTLKYLNELKSIFNDLLLKYKFKIHIVGGRNSIGVSAEAEEVIEWSEEKEVSEIKKFDIGVMPLKNSEWEKGKCAYKLIQCMACGVAVIASNVGANASVIKDSYNGYLANTKEDWYKKLEILLTDKKKRSDLGQNGYSIVMEKYTLNAAFNQYFSSLKSASD